MVVSGLLQLMSLLVSDNGTQLGNMRRFYSLLSENRFVCYAGNQRGKAAVENGEKEIWAWVNCYSN